MAKSPARRAPKRKVIPHQNPPHAKPSLKNMQNKIFSAYPGEIEIKAAYLHPIDTGSREQLQFLPQARETRRRLIRCEKLGADGVRKSRRKW